MGPKKKKEEACWRCSTCNLNYPDDTEIENCVVCDSKLNHFTGVAAHEDLIDRIKAAVWRKPSSQRPEFGASALERFGKEVNTLVGVDDFLFECGEQKPAVEYDDD